MSDRIYKKMKNHKLTIQVPSVPATSYPVVIGRQMVPTLLARLREQFPKRRPFVISDANLQKSGWLDKLIGKDTVGRFVIDPAGRGLQDLGHRRGDRRGDGASFAGPRHAGHRPWRRDRRRHGRLCRVDLQTRRAGGACPHDHGRPGRLGHRRQDRRGFVTIQECLWHLPPPGGRVHRCRDPGDAGRPPAPGPGPAESVKHALIADAEYFAFLEINLDAILARDLDRLEQLAAFNCRIKGSVVEQDPTETNQRRLLNYGHTIGHAVETAAGYRLLHGEAVAIGIAAALQIEKRMRLADDDRIERICALLGRLSVRWPSPPTCRPRRSWTS